MALVRAEGALFSKLLRSSTSLIRSFSFIAHPLRYSGACCATHQAEMHDLRQRHCPNGALTHCKNEWPEAFSFTLRDRETPPVASTDTTGHRRPVSARWTGVNQRRDRDSGSTTALLRGRRHNVPTGLAPRRLRRTLMEDAVRPRSGVPRVWLRRRPFVLGTNRHTTSAMSFHLSSPHKTFLMSSASDPLSPGFASE
jgi:hypothetical protein